MNRKKRKTEEKEKEKRISIYFEDVDQDYKVAPLKFDIENILQLANRSLFDLFDHLKNSVKSDNKFNTTACVKLKMRDKSFYNPIYGGKFRDIFTPRQLELMFKNGNYMASFEVLKIPEDSKKIKKFQIFVKATKNKTITLDVNHNDTIEIIKQNIQDKEGISLDQQRIIYWGQELRDDQTLFQNCIYQECTVLLVLRLRGGGGGCCGNFADVSKESMQTIGLTKSDDSVVAFQRKSGRQWLIVKPGLNMEGICENQMCVIFGREFVAPIDDREVKFDDRYKIDCPMCKYSTKPITCGFLKCNWSIDALKKNGEVYHSDWKQASTNAYDRFDDDEKCDWEYITFLVKFDDVAYGNCSICLNDFTEFDQGIKTDCGHEFHQKCIQMWKRACENNNICCTCPLCRTLF